MLENTNPFHKDTRLLIAVEVRNHSSMKQVEHKDTRLRIAVDVRNDNSKKQVEQVRCDK